jgi:RNA polymerase sigma factor (sigma-70 family)
LVETLEILVQRAQTGDTQAYEVIVRRFQDMAVGYSFSFLGDMQLAEDAAQEAFINAYYDLPALRNPAAFPGWFRRIVFKHIDRARRGKHVTLLSLEDVSPLADSTSNPALIAEKRELTDYVRAAIAGLPEHQRSVVTLFYISEYPLKEISAFLEVPLGTVKTRLYTARQQLKQRILTLMQEELFNQRPSRNDAFTQKVIQFFRATAEGNVEQVQTLLTEDAALARATGLVESPLWQSETSALHLAVMHGRKDIIDLLLAHGADINEKDKKWGFTALHHAIDLAAFLTDYAELGMVEFLLSRGAHKDIFAHLWLNDLEGVENFLAGDPAAVNAIGPNSGTPLCHVFDLPMARLLLEHGADMFFPLDSAWGKTTPLRWVASRPAVFRFLLDYAGVPLDIFLWCVLGETDQVAAQIVADPALVHARTGPDHVLEPDLTALHLAAQYGHVAIASLLLNAGADVNATAPAVYDMTPLHLAIWRGRRDEPDTLPETADPLQGPGVLQLLPDIPKLLLEHGADVAARDSERELTPLGWAESNLEDETDRSAVIALLRQFSAQS